MAAKGFGSAEELEAALREYVAALPEGQVEDDTLTLVLALALALALALSLTLTTEDETLTLALALIRTLIRALVQALTLPLTRWRTRHCPRRSTTRSSSSTVAPVCLAGLQPQASRPQVNPGRSATHTFEPRLGQTS